jgi:phosphatidylglycerol---prolipoprotein diacylglyceryl transferase
MHPVIISIGPFAIRAYGLMLAIAFFTGITVAVWRAKRAGESPDHIYNLSVWIVLSSLFGARLYYILTHFSEFRAEETLPFFIRIGTELKNMFWPVGPDGQIGISGLVLYGGLIGATIATALYLRLHKLNILKYLDFLGPSLGLGEFFTRIGCFLNGCCYGKPTTSCIGVIFPDSSIAGYDYPGIPLHPAQLYNSLAGLIIFFALLFLERYKWFDGYTAYLYFILYAIARFSIDFFRVYENNLELWGLSHNQILSIIVFFVALTLFISRGIKTKKLTRTS